MKDFYIRLENAEKFESLSGLVPFEYGEGGVIGTSGWSIDILGDGQTKVVSWDSEGNPTLEPVGGFLVNLRSDSQLPENLREFEVFPKTPIRVWA